jgi:hypothetical protein
VSCDVSVLRAVALGALSSLGVLLISNTVRAAERLKTHADSKLTITVGDCRAAYGPYFAIDVQKSGLVKFEGVRGTRELGVANLNVPSSKVRQLIEAADRFVATRGSKVADRYRNDQLDSNYCISVSGTDLKGAASTITNMEAKSAERFFDLVDHLLQVRKYACPGRAFEFATARGICPSEDFVLVYGDDRCDFTHIVQGYAHSQLHYFAAEIEGSDAYVHIGKARYRKLRTAIDQMSVIADGAAEGNGPMPLYGTESELSQFRRVLTSEMGLPWTELPSDDVLCAQQNIGSTRPRWLSR